MVRENKCCIQNCPGLHKSRFSIPQHSFNEWQEAIGTSLTKRSRICGAHFSKNDIHDTWTSGEGSNQYSICLKKPRLKDGAVPKLLLNGNAGNVDTPITLNTSSSFNVEPSIHSASEVVEINQNTNENMEWSVSSDINTSYTSLTSSTTLSTDINENSELYNLLLKKSYNIKLPSCWLNDLTTNKKLKTKFISFFKMGCYGNRCQRIVEKQLVVTEKSELIIYVLDVQLSVEEIEMFYPTSSVTLTKPTILDIEKIISTLDKAYVCYGAALVSDFPNVKPSFGFQYTMSNGYWKHSNCKKISIENSGMCSWCQRLCFSLKRKNKRLMDGDKINIFFSPSKLKPLNKLRHTKRVVRQKAARANTRIMKLQNSLREVQNQMKMFSEESLTDIVEKSGISQIQSDLLHEIFAAAKLKNNKSRRYSENWMLLCLLFQIRSPSGYKFLKEQGVLPLPCVETIRRHLLAVKNGCGFDLSFFKLLKKKCLSYTPSQKKGILLLDEIFLRKNIHVNSRSLTYSGLEDFGGEIKNKVGSSEEADHGLVFMWQGLATNVTQPIAVFASKGPVKGVDLSQLLIKAILMLEDAGLQVLGVTCDGASTNKTMFKTLGINGSKSELKNYFVNPYDELRKIFIFSDAPHVIKNIRNRLVQKKQLKLHPLKDYVKWEHYCSVFNNDSKTMLKICPKITKAHIELNNLSKMKVKYATQIFSNSMAIGIRFYRDRKLKGLEDSLETEEFTLFLNNMFDVLNRKFPAEGIKKHSKDLEVLNQSLIWLDNWEQHFIDGKILEKEFLTRNTADSLRLTLKSTIDLVTYLLDECNFQYVLTSKFNQDAIEKFFGIVRQTAGPNDHPATPTFLQLYRLLSVYSLVKPPKSGNCTLSEDSNYSPALTITDLKEAAMKNPSQRVEKINQLKSQIDLIVEEGRWDLDDIFENSDISKADTFDCVVYYLAGYLARRIAKKTDCPDCLAGIKNFDEVTLNYAELVNLKSRGYLTHPDSNFYVLLRRIESSFMKHASSACVFDDTVEDFISNNYIIPFPCNVHKEEVILDILISYITMRMRQHSYMTNKKLKSQNIIKKKLSKLVSK